MDLAALPHYAPEQTGSAIIDRKSPYLNDSGAQYLGPSSLLSLLPLALKRPHRWDDRHDSHRPFRQANQGAKARFYEDPAGAYRD